MELKPCPFCGGEARIENNDHIIYDPDTLGVIDVEYGDPPVFWANCGECEALVAEFDTEEEAITAWNRRAPLDAADKQIPRKVIETPDKHRYGHCPACGRIYWDASHIGNYCDSCGQRLEGK